MDKNTSPQTRKHSRRLRDWLRQPRIRYGAISTALLCLFLVMLVLINVWLTDFEKRKGLRVDYSFNQVSTTSEQTVEILQTLPHDVHIYALFSKGQEDGPLMELLNRYASVTQRVTWELTDVNMNPALLTKFSGVTKDQALTNDSLIVYCPETDRWRILQPSDFISVSLNYEEGRYEIAGLTYEEKITQAIAYVAQDVIPRVLILQGHG